MAKNINRKQFITMAAGVAGAGILAGCVPAAPAAPAPAAAPAATTQPSEAPAAAAAAPAAAAKTVYMGTVIRTLANEYHAAWFKGAQMFADSIGQGKTNRGLLCEGDSEKQLTLMKALIARGRQGRHLQHRPQPVARLPNRSPTCARKPASTS